MESLLQRKTSRMAVMSDDVEEASAPPIHFGDQIILQDNAHNGFVQNELSR